MAVKATASRGNVSCAVCGKTLRRVLWKYSRQRPITTFFCNHTCKGIWQRQRREALGFTREWLHQKYIIEGLDCTKIAAIAKRDPKRVWEWLRDYGIPTRKRGGYTAPGSFKIGQPSLFRGHKHSAATKAKTRALAIATGRVPYDPAVGSYMKGRKGKDTPGWKGGITPERQAFYSSPEWRKASRAVRKRDGWTCQRCGIHQSCRSCSFDIHHIVSFACVALRAETENLVLLCERCHYWVHSKSNTNRLFIMEQKNVAS